MCFKEPNMQRLNYSAFNMQKQAKFPRDVEELCQLMQSRCRSCTGRHAGAACSCRAHVTSAGIIPPQVLSILQGAGAAPGLTHAQAPPLCLCHQLWWQQVTGQGRKRPRRLCLCRQHRAACLQRYSTASAALLYDSAPEQSSPCNH